MAQSAPGWRRAFVLHLQSLELFLIERRLSGLSGENAVYLAGMIARELDPEYRAIADAYVHGLERGGWRRFDKPDAALLERLAASRNDSNRRKDFWEAAWISHCRRNRIALYEFRRMVDFERPN